MNYKKIIIAGIVAGIVHIIFGTLTCGWLFKRVYEIEPVNVWKFTGQIGLAGGQILIMTVGTIITSIILATVYAWIHKGLPGSGAKKGLYYGSLVWLVGTLPGMFSIYMWMTVATAVVVYWTIIGLVNWVLLGLVIAGIYKDKKVEKEGDK